MRTVALVLAAALTGCTGPPPPVVFDRLDEQIARGGVLRLTCHPAIGSCGWSIGRPLDLSTRGWPHLTHHPGD